MREINEIKAMSESEELYKLVAENSSDMIWTLNLEGNFTYVSPAVMNLLGYTPEEFVELDYRQFMIPESIDILQNTANRILEDIELGRDTRGRLEIEMLHRSGHVLWAETSYSIMYDQAGGRIGILGATHDISVRKQAEIALRESEEKYRILFEDSVDPVLIIQDDKFVTANSSAFRFLGYLNKDELLNKHPAEISPPLQPDGNESLERAELLMLIAYEYGMSRYEWVYKKKNGTFVYVDVVLTRIPLDGKYILHAHWRDITETKKLEQQLLGLNIKFLSHIQNMPLGYMELDRNMILTDWNPFAEQIFGYKREEVVGQKITELIFTRYSRVFVEMMGYSLHKGSSGKRSINENVTKDGKEIICEWHNTPLYDDTGIIYGWASLVKDITEQKRSEEALRKAKEEAERGNAAKSEFIANMSHEIRTPLNAVIGFSELLSGLVEDDKHRNYIESINVAGRSLLTLINDILDLSKIEAGMIEMRESYINPTIFLNEIKKIFKQKTEEKNLVFHVDIDPDIPAALLIDETRLRQILLNLVGNSLKFTEKGFIKIMLKVKTEIVDENNVSDQQNPIDKKNGRDTKKNTIDVIFAVEDSGIGIRENERELIFESFRQQTGQDSKKYGGTGLGLTISKKLVAMMNGSLRLESEIGKGSTFIVELNDLEYSHDGSYLRDANSTDLVNTKFESGTVLVVDDIEANRKLINEMLLLMGIEGIYAQNGKEAVEKAIIHKPDIILMDIRMPFMDGFQAAKEIKSRDDLHKTKIIAFTASCGQTDIKTFTDGDFDGYLLKPVSYRKLFGEIKRFLKPSEKVDKDPNLNNMKNSLANQNSANGHEIEFSKLRPEVINQLKEKILPIATNMKGAMKVTEVVNLAKELIRIGTEYDLDIITQKGEYLRQAANRYDINEMKKCITYFLNMG